MKKGNMASILFFGFASAIVFAITILFFIRSANFVSTWWLYLGNVLFGLVICWFMIRHIYFRREGASTGSMVLIGHVVTIAGVVISCVLSFILLLLFMPDVFGSGQQDTVLQHAPSQQKDGKTNGMVLMIFMNAVIGNVATGSFASIILAYTAKVNQTSDKESNFLKDELETKSTYPGQAG